jgi:hypothetical protein
MEPKFILRDFPRRRGRASAQITVAAPHKRGPIEACYHPVLAHCRGPCLAMAKFKPVRPKKAKTPPVEGGIPCLIVIFLAMVLVGVVMFLVMKYANG